MSKGGGEKTQPIVIKRKKVAGGHHGGAWKIAYADFVTAMMAFFLLMWLLGSTTKGELMGISEYFQTPLQVALFGGSGSGDSSSVIKGGGRELTRSSGQVKRGDLDSQKKVVNLRAAHAELDLPSRMDDPSVPDPKRSMAGGGEPASAPKEASKDAKSASASARAAEMERKDMESLKGLKAKIEKLIDISPNLRPFKSQLLLAITDEGLRIQIIDEQNRPMFDLASPVLKGYAQVILREIGVSINEVSNRITISGHTDSLAYRGGDKGYSNWELSSDRANSARREMTRAGMADDKVLRVVGHGSSALLNPEEPTDPMNRRISIVVLKKSEEKKARQEARASAKVSDSEQARAVVRLGASR